MSPILGVLASAQQGAFAVGDYESIATVTVGAGGSSSISFTSIPSTYTHLQIRAVTRSTNASANTDSIIRFNNDSTSGRYYYYHQLFGDGASAVSNTGNTDTTSTLFSFMPAASATASIFNASIVDILDYTNTNKNKTVRNLHGFDVNGAGGYVIFRSGLWMQTNAISQIDITSNAGNFAQYSSFALYGIK